MKNKIDYILMGLLWLLAATLGICFWFNTAFGFNIFSAQHWQHLAYMQAAHQSVKPSFYISLVVAVFLTIIGLYVLLRPRLRRIKLSIFKKSDTPKTLINANTKKSRDAPITISHPAPAAVPETPHPTPTQQSAPAPTTAAQRPPRLSVPMNKQSAAHMVAPATATAAASAQFVQPNAPDPKQYTDELTQIFESAGYVAKGAPKIGNVRTALMAIGANDVLWLGAVGIKTTDMRTAIDRLQQVFSDTLDDIEIGVNGFVINAPDAATSEFQDILMFDSVDAVREYILAHPNPPIPPDDMGNFDAYSSYISIVADYIGKI